VSPAPRALIATVSAVVVELVVALHATSTHKHIDTYRHTHTETYTHCLTKHATTSSTISWTRIVRLQQVWHTVYQQYRPSTDVFIFQPHLLRFRVPVPTLPWETVKT